MTTREGANPSNIYKVAMANTGDLTRRTIPAATRSAATNAIVPGTAKVTLSFRPVLLGARQGTFSGSTDARNQTSFTVPLRGIGGGPDIDLQPANTLNFGRIAYFTGNTSSATRRVTLRNVGTRPTPPDPRANLKLGAMGAGRPYWTVTAKNAESSLSEICVGRFDAMTNTCAASAAPCAAAAALCAAAAALCAARAAPCSASSLRVNWSSSSCAGSRSQSIQVISLSCA
jgi:hypothetical protein